MSLALPCVANISWFCSNYLNTTVVFRNSVDPNDQKKTACYDIDVEVDDTLKTQMNSFLLSTASQQEIAGLDNKVHLIYILRCSGALESSPLVPQSTTFGEQLYLTKH